MNPEIKAAIEKEIRLLNLCAKTCEDCPPPKEIFTDGAEYGYKLGLLVGKIEAYTDYNNTEFFEVLLKAEKIKLQELLK